MTFTFAAASSNACNLGHTSPTLRDESMLTEPTHRGATAVVADSGVDSGGPITSADGTDSGLVAPSSYTEDAGREPPCSEGAYRCVSEGSTDREKCEGGHWVTASSCGSGGICEVANSTTTSCVIPLSECDGGNCETCNAATIDCEYLEGAEDVAFACHDGTPRRSACRGATSHCVNQLGCKACSQTAHCTATPPDCYEYTCTDRFTCELVGLPHGAPCQSGVCNAAHECVDCVVESDCGTPAPCRSVACDDGNCIESLANARSTCTSDDGSLCNEAGECVACLIHNDCPSEDVPACYRATCTTGGYCEPAASDLGTACTGDENVCDGAGACVPCVNKTHCDGEAVCHDSQCVSPYVLMGWSEESEDDAATAFAGFVYLRRLEPLGYPATLGSFGAIARTTTTTAIDIGIYADNGDGTWPKGAALTVQRLEGIPEDYQTTPASTHPTLEAGKYYWLGFRVSDDVDLQLSDTPLLTYVTGRRAQSGDFGTPFYVASDSDAPGGDSIEAYSVFAIVQYTQ